MSLENNFTAHASLYSLWLICLSLVLLTFYRYGVVLEKFQKQDASLLGRIKGCIVDSAPVAAADPQVIH